MKNKFLLGFVLFSFVVLLSSCSKLPKAELNALSAAIEDARANGADIYLPADFAALQDSMNVINTMVEEQKGKLFGNFKAVDSKIAELTATAANVAGQVDARKTEVKDEIDLLMVEVTSLVGTAKGLLTKAPRGKEGAAALEAIKTEIGVVETAVTESVGKLQEGDLMGTLDQLKSGKEKVEEIISELNSVIAKVKR